MNPELIKIIPNLPIIENVQDINKSTRIKRDLKLSGSAARKFLFEYGDKFSVDLSRFRFKKYFFADFRYVPSFLKFLNWKNDIELGQLQQAIPYKRLDEAVLKKIAEKQTEKPARKKIHFKGQASYSTYDILIYTLIGIALFVFASIIAVFFT